ncbi:MAG: hypothetical protein P8P30_05970 [Rickettsiales bacterium]|nr:hypothetical protein [Rickettsiales bacterium]
MSNELWSSVKEGIEASADMLLDIVDNIGKAVQSGVMSMAAGAGGKLSAGVKGSGTGLVNLVTPAPSLGDTKSSPSPTMGVSQGLGQAAPSQSQGFGEMLGDMPQASFDVQAADLGSQAAIGYGGVAANAHDAPDVSVGQGVGQSLFS